MSYDYYENLDCDTAKARLKALENGLDELGRALTELPEVPNIDVLILLSSPAMNTQGVNFGGIGKELQSKHGIEAVPPNCEVENAAGLWKVIRDAVEKCRN